MSLWLRALLGTAAEQGEAARLALRAGWALEPGALRCNLPGPAAYELRLRSPEGSTATVTLDAEELAVLADFAQTIGHPDAERLAGCAQREIA